jgi:archaellum component FlaC
MKLHIALASATLAALTLAGPASAQERRKPTIEVVPPPDWSIRKEVDRLDNSMKEYSSLIKSLSTASNDLGKAFKKYLKDPHNEVLASFVEKKMAVYAKRVMADFDDIIADQDVLGSNFRELQRKLIDFGGHLGGQAKGFNVKLQGYRTKAREHERKLKELATKLKEDPPTDEDELRLLKREFSRELRRYNLQGRYVRGYQSRFKSYQGLQKNMKRLAGMFVNLHDKFNEMIENLENERQYLNDSLRLQADTLRIKQIVREGFLGSEKAIANVADKLANLYNKVDAFSQVHERINSDLNTFVESQGALMDVTKRINAIGTKGGPLADLTGDLDKAIDLFYKQKDEPEDGKLIVEKIKAKAKARKGKKPLAKKPGVGKSARPKAPLRPAPSPLRPAPRRSTQPAPSKLPASPKATTPKAATAKKPGRLVPLPSTEPLPESKQPE